VAVRQPVCELAKEHRFENKSERETRRLTVNCNRVAEHLIENDSSPDDDVLVLVA
jgi:hypothetical protein